MSAVHLDVDSSTAEFPKFWVTSEDKLFSFEIEEVRFF
jgi:hypothetical protein